MRVRLAACGFWLLLVPAFAAEEKPSAPPAAEARAMRDVLVNDLDALFLLQDATARGRSDAAALQKQLLVGIGQRLSESGSLNPNVLAPLAAGYVLSGGNPDAAATLSKAEALTPVHRQLLEGVSYFMRGEGEEAAKRLLNLETSRLPARIAGRVALAQSLLEQEPGARQARLSAAVAAMPGTLVEESALRRSALAFAESADEPGFWRRLERYQRRFPDSLYARAFWQEIMFNLAKWSATDKAPGIGQLDLVLMEMPPSRRRELYLQLTRQAARINLPALVNFAARRAQRLAVAGSQEDQTARFYMAIHDVASEQADEARTELEKINRGLLLPREQGLLDAALWIARQLNSPAAPDPGITVAGTAAKSPIEERAERLLSETEKLLAESQS